MAEDIQGQLYKQLSEKYDFGDETAFRNALRSKEGAKYIYDTATQGGYDLGDYNSFENSLGFNKPAARKVEKVVQPKEQTQTERPVAVESPQTQTSGGKRAVVPVVEIGTPTVEVEDNGVKKSPEEFLAGTEAPQHTRPKGIPDYTKAPTYPSVNESWAYTKTASIIDYNNPLEKGAMQARKYGELLTSGEANAIRNNTNWDDLARQSKALQEKYKGGVDTSSTQYMHDAQLLAAIHNRMVNIELGINGSVSKGERQYRLYADEMRREGKYFSFYDELLKNGTDLRHWNPFMDLTDKVMARREADRKAGKNYPDNYYYHMALKDGEFRQKVHEYALALAKQTGMEWGEAKNWAAKHSDRLAEQFKENRAKEFADSPWYSVTSALVDNSVADVVKTAYNTYDLIKGQPLRTEGVNDLLQRSMKYAGEGKNVTRGVLSFIPDAVTLMPVTGVAATRTVGALSKIFTFTPRAMKITTGSLSFMGYEMAKTALGAVSRGDDINWAEMAGNSAKGFILGGGGALISEGVAGIAPRVNSTAANYAIQGVGKVAEVGQFASFEMAMAYLGNDKETTWTSSLLNNGALIVSMAIGHGIGHGFGFKSRISTNTIDKVRKAGYNTLANEMAKHTQAVERGAMPKGYSQAAIQEMQSMQQSMGSNGLSWSDYAEVLKPTNSIMTKPGTNSIEKVKDGNGYRIVSYDVNGVEIERSKVYNEAAIDKKFAKRQREVEKKREEANVKSFDIMRESTINAKAARAVADALNQEDGKSVYNTDGTVNEAFDGITADDILNAYEVLSEKPAEQLSESESRLVSMFKQQAEQIGAGLLDSQGVKRTICERYGISEEAFDAAWKADAKDRKEKEAEACAAYNTAISRDYSVTAGIETARGAVDGVEATIKSRVETNAEGLPLDPNQKVYYELADGETRVTTAEHVLVEPQAEDPGVLGDRIANDNLTKLINEKTEEVRANFAEVSTEDLEDSLNALRNAIKYEGDEDGSKRLLSIALTKEIESRRAAESDAMRAEWNGMTHGEKVQHFVDKKFSGRTQEEREELTRYYTEHPSEFDDVLSYDGTHSAEISALVDSMGLTNLREWNNKYKEYKENEESFRKDFKKKFGVEPTERPYGFERKEGETDGTTNANPADTGGEGSVDAVSPAIEDGADIVEPTAAATENESRRKAVEAFAEGYFGDGKVPEGWVQTMIDNPAEFNRFANEVSRAAELSPDSNAARAIDSFQSAREENKQQESVVSETPTPAQPSGLVDILGIPEEYREGWQRYWEQNPPKDAIDILLDRMDVMDETQRAEMRKSYEENPEFFQKEWDEWNGDVSLADVERALGLEPTVREEVRADEVQEQKEPTPANEPVSEKPAVEPINEPTEAPKPENEMQPVKVEGTEEEAAPPAAETDNATEERNRKIDELLDFMGIEGEEREGYREGYISNPEALDEDYNDYLAEKQKEETEETPKEEEPSKEEPTTEGPAEPRIVDNLDEAMPMLDDGEPNVELATPRRTRHYLYEESGLEAKDATDKVDYEIKKAKDAAKKAEKGEPKMSDKGIDGNIGKLKKAKQEWNDKKAAADAKLEYWNEVKRQQGLYDLIDEIGETKTPKSMADLIVKLKSRFKNDAEISSALNSYTVEPRNMYEACMLYLGSGVRFVWDSEGARKGLKQELGYGDEERSKMVGLLSKDGITVQRAVHDIVDQYGADLGFDLSRSQEVYDTLIDALSSVSTRGDVFAFINERRLNAVEDILRKRLGNGDVQSREESEADIRANEEFEALKEQYKDELPENPTEDDVLNLMERKRQEREDVNVDGERQTEDTLPDETGVDDDFFEGGKDEYVPFRDGEEEAGETSQNGRFGVKNKNIYRSDTNSTKKDVSLQERVRKSYRRTDGTYVEGLEDELQRLEEELRQEEKETGEVDPQREDSASPVQKSEQGGRRGEVGLIDEPHNIISLRNRISLIRRELVSRDRTKEELKKKYGIADNGDISFENIAKMFHDLNSDKAVGELFEKVFSVLKTLKNDFRFSDNVRGSDNAASAEFLKMAFYKWDSFVRGRSKQDKARTLLHEMIHNAATHVISSYETPVLRILLSPAQRSAAKTLIDIYKRANAADLRNSRGIKFNGLKNANEMVAELANPEFRKALETVEYNHRSLWQIAKEAIRKLFGLDVPVHEGNALDEASKALDKILDSYGTYVNRAKRNAMRAGYNARQKIKGKNPVDVVESELNKDSHYYKGDEEKTISESGELYRDNETPTFYSNAARAVENIKQNKATAEQWKAMLTKAGGIKSGEDKWMGLSAWLDENKGKSLTKDEVLQFVRDNGIQMEEVNYDRKAKRANIINDNHGGFAVEGHPEYTIQTMEDPIADGVKIYIVTKYGEELGKAYGIYKAESIIDDDLNRVKPINSTRLDYTTKGLENKREIAFVVPNIEPYQVHDEIHFGPENQGKAVMWVRFGETTDADGKRVLVIDEIQSNRHQDAREKGYTRNATQEEKERNYKEYQAFIESMREKYKWRKNDNGWMAFANSDELARLWQLENPEWSTSSGRVPAAPFEKNWHEVAIKRMLRLAAEEGFDKVAWTTGEQQAKRYHIGNVVDRIISYDYPSGDKSVKKIEVRLKDGETMPIVVDENGIVVEGRNGIEGKPLSEILGKELSVRIMQGEGRDGTMWDGADRPAKIIEGDGLRIGGEGMKGFYDNILPRFMDKYGKRWGVKTGTVELPNVEEAGRTMHSVDVTPEMKESVMQGQPLFRQQEPMGERGVKKVTQVRAPEYREGTDYFGRPMMHRVNSGQYKVEGYDDIFNSVEEVADFMRKKNPDYCVYIDEDGNIGYEAWSNILPEGVKPNTYAKILATNGGKLSSAMKKRIERYTQREMKQARTRAEEITKELGLDVEFHDDPSEFSGRKSRAKGWYDPKTGKIHVVMGNHSGVSDVLATMLHEGVAHHGLRKLFGEDFDTFLDNVHNNVSEDIRADISGRIDKMRGNDQEGAHSDDYYRRAATEEYLADLAEDGLYNGEQNTGYASRAWQYIKESFINLLRKAGINIELTDDELRYILWSSHKNLRRGAEAMAEDAVMREKAGIKDYVEDGEPVNNVAESGRQMSLFPEGNMRSLGGAREMRDAELLEEIGKDRYDVRSVYTDEYDRRHNREYNENYDSTTKMLEDDNTSIKQVEEMLIDAAYYLRNNYTSKERAVAMARFDAIQEYYFNKEAELEKARDDFFAKHEEELKERFGDYYDEEENIDKLMSEYGIVRESRIPYGAVSEAREILRGADDRFRDGEEEQQSDLASRLRERMRQRMERARGANNGGEEPRTESGSSGGVVPPVEPPTSSAPATPEPAPELPSTDYDRPMSPIEQAQAAAIKAVNDTKASLEQRNAARRELTASLRDLHKAMRLQKEYDRATVENVVNLCKMMVQSGLIDRSYVSNLTPLFTKLKDATGKQDLTSTVNDIMDVMLKSQERSVRNEIAKLLNTKGTKVDQNGVVTQAGLDIRGQHTMKELSEYMGKGSVIIDNHISKLEAARARTPDGHQERIDDIDDKILGSQLAKQFSEIEETHSVNISEAEQDLNFLKERYKAGEIGVKEYTEQKHALENLIRSYRMAQTDALWNQANALRYVIAGSKEGTRNWIEQQKQHKNEILHNAYSDMEGASKQTQGDPTTMQKVMNMSVPKFFSSSLYTLQTMLKSLGNKHALGEGYLYNRFFRGWMEQRDAEITEYRDDMNELNSKAKELTGHSYFGIYDMIQKLPKMTVEYMDGGEMLPHELDQGQLGYAYMVNKMEDGAAALRNMGITEEKMEEISNFLNPDLKKFYDWLQDDFLAGKWDGMNEVHKRLFGADMDRVANYIPLRRDRGAGTQKVDISQENEQPLQSTVVGSIIQRVHSNLGIDLKHNNAIDVVANHLLEATHWKHFSEWKRDANTLLSDTTFRNKVKNTATIYGSGDVLWNRLNQVFQIAGGDYKPKAHSAGVDKAIVDMARTVNTAKVSMRVFTAAKQLLSLPVFATECNTAVLLKNLGFLLSPVTSKNVAQNSFLWCLQNLPQFRERWVSRTAGETRLENGDLGWGYSRQKVLEAAGRIGLTPNAFIDVCTVAAGAKSIYEKRFAQYKKDGYSEEAASKKAKIDAETAFNESQQSSEKAFVSPIQVDRTAVALGLSTFRNASMGFERKFVDAIRNFRHLTDHKETVEFMKKQMERDGLTETQAKDAAERLYRRALWRSTLNFLMFGFGAQMAWNVGGKLPYLIFGDDEEEKKKIVEQAAIHAGIGGWIEGLPAGDMLSEGMTNWAMNLIESGNPLEGNSFFEFDPDLLTVTSDFVKMTKALEGKNPLKGATDFVNLLAQIYTGVNPQTFTDAGVAIYDACDGNPEVGNEALMCILRIMQCPQSQLDQMYIDELKMSAREAQKLTPEEVARRYAYYKAHKDTPYMWWMYNQDKKDEIVKKYEGDFNKKLNTDVKEEGGTPEDYHDLSESATTEKKTLEYRSKEIDALSAQGPEALMKAWEKERDKGAAADYKYMKSLMTRYQKDVYGKGKTPTDEDEAELYQETHGEDIKEQAQKIGRDLGFSAQDSYFQMSQYKAQHTSAKDPAMKKLSDNSGGFRYSEKGKFFDINDYQIKKPVKDAAKRANVEKVVKENRELLKRNYRNGWRMARIKALYKDIEAEIAEGKEGFERDKVKKNFEEILYILEDERKDAAEWERTHPKVKFTKKIETY